jgi:hypothetical protein
MKKNLALIIVFIWIMTGCQNNKQIILEFNQSIITEQEAVFMAENKLVKTLNSKAVTLLDSNYQFLLQQIIRSDSILTRISDPEPKIGFKQAAIHLVNVYKVQTITGYSKLVELSKIPDSLYSPREAKKFEEISSSVFVTLNAEFDEFINVQSKLIEKYEFLKK